MENEWSATNEEPLQEDVAGQMFGLTTYGSSDRTKAGKSIRRAVCLQ